MAECQDGRMAANMAECQDGRIAECQDGRIAEGTMDDELHENENI
jgi:hypothetical protein